LSAGHDPAHWAREEERFTRSLQAAKRRRILMQLVLNVLGIVLFLAAWEASPRIIPWLNPILFPPPTETLHALQELLESGELVNGIAISLRRAFFGFMVGSLLGILLGLLTGQIAAIQHLTDPLLHGFRSIPAIALVPLSLLWFGIGEASKVALIAWGSFYPVWLNTYTGVRNVPEALQRSAASLGAQPYQAMFLVVLPASLPFILAGLRQAVGIALIVLVAAELAGASSGVGYLIAVSHQLFRVDIMFVGIATLGFLGFLVDRLFALAQTYFFPWYSGAK
jgi:ABC-type nitrate/sulfonate/bicarbonate transport system permease component